MRKIRLVRLHSDDQGTLGVLLFPDGRSFFTNELPWRDNATNISCIPTGKYQAEVTYSGTFNKDLYLLTGPAIEGKRSGIRIHVGNLAGDEGKGFDSDVEGCIVLGTSCGRLGENQRAVTNSATAHEHFWKQVEEEPFTLVIEEAFAPQFG